jgi:hypothetical protein
MCREVYDSMKFINVMSNGALFSWILDLFSNGHVTFISDMIENFVEHFIVIEDLVDSGANISQRAVHQRRYNLINDMFTSRTNTMNRQIRSHRSIIPVVY